MHDGRMNYYKKWYKWLFKKKINDNLCRLYYNYSFSLQALNIL